LADNSSATNAPATNPVAAPKVNNGAQTTPQASAQGQAPTTQPTQADARRASLNFSQRILKIRMMIPIRLIWWPLLGLAIICCVWRLVMGCQKSQMMVCAEGALFRLDQQLFAEAKAVEVRVER